METRELKLKNRIMSVAVGLLLIQQLLKPHKSWLILLVGLGGAWLISFIWAGALMRGVWFSRDVRSGLAQVGDHLQEQFTLGNDSWVPALWITVADHSDLPGYQVNTARYVEDRAIKRWLKGAVCTRRGFYTFGPTSLETGDPFGFYTVRVHYPAVKNMLVMPQVVPLPTIEIATGDRVGEGGTRAHTPERTVTAASVRDYVTGDDLHAVHWLTSARRDDLYIRNFDSTPTSDWWIFLDLDQNVQSGEEQEATEEYGVILAASIADRGLRNGRAVGLVAQGNKKIWLPPKTGNGQRWDILRSLAVIEPGPSTLKGLMATTQGYLEKNSSLIVITASSETDWLAGLITLIRKNITPTVLILDSISFGGEGSVDQVLPKLAAWGVNHHRITPEIFEMPVLEGDLVWRRSPYARSSSKFTVSELDWSNLK